MEQMTVLSSKMYQRAIQVKTVSQAARILQETGNMRTLGDILRTHAKNENPKVFLVDKLSQVTPELSRDSIDRKVRNWLNGRTTSVSKHDAYILSRILDLDLEQTDIFLKQVTGEGIHWRNPEEIIWAYGISQNIDCARIFELHKKLAASGLKLSGKEKDTNHYTEQVRQKFQSLLCQSEEELLQYLRQEWASLGTFHNTAHELFKDYMELLESGDTDNWLNDASKMTSGEVLESYLYRKIIPAGKNASASLFSAMQRSVRATWPDETTISKMKHREIDVTRKVLILLFLATDGSNTEYEELDEDEDILTRDEIFLNTYTRLNRMLHACGFQMLDPRSPFDWIVLYSICADEFWDIDQRMHDILQAIFPDGNDNQ